MTPPRATTFPLTMRSSASAFRPRPSRQPVFPAPWRPNHFYDEQRLLLGRTFPAGSMIRLTAPVGTDASLTTIDLMDSQLVGAAQGRFPVCERAAIRC